MAYRIDDDENRIQDLKDKIDQLEVQTFSPEVVARNESTRNTGIETGSGAATNPYPLWYPIRDFGTIGSITLDIVLNRTDSHVAKLTANGDIDFAFSFPPGTNKMMWFILDVTIDAVGGYTFNLLNNILPAGISIDNSANARTVIRFTTTDAGVTYYAENLSTGGGAGLTEPIELGFNEVVTQTPPTKTIVAGDQFNPSHIILDQDIEIQLDISATTSKYKSIFVIIDTTGGGFTVTWPGTVANPPVIDDSIAQRISVILYTINNGVLWTNAVSGSSVPGSAEFFGPWTAAHDASNQNLIGLNTLNFFQAGQSIQTKADPDGGLLYDVADLQSHIFRANLDEIARFEESAAGVFRLDMLDHTIDNAKDYRFDPTASYSIPGSQPGIGFDDANNRMRINVPTGSQVSFEENSAGFGTGVTIGPASGGSVTANIINASDVLQLGVDVTVPTVEGEFRSDGTKVTVFSGGAVRNLNNIGAGSPLTTKGDIFTFDTVNARLPVGTDGQRLTANSAVALGVEWQDVVVPNSISQGDSNVTVTDVGSGLVATAVDGATRFSVQASRIDVEDLPLFGLTQVSFTNASLTKTVLTQNINDFTMNFLTNTDDFIINFNGVTGFIVDKDFTRVASTSPNVTEAVFELFRDDPSPLAGDEVGIFKFRGRNSAGAITTYTQIESEIIDPLSTNETSRLRWSIFDSNIFVNSMILSPGNLTVREFKTVPAATDKAIFHLLKEDATPAAADSIGSVDFDILDTGVTTTYSQILGKVGDATDFGILELRVRADNVGLTTGLTLTGDDNVTNRSYLTVDARINSNLAFGFDGVGSLDAKISPVSASTTLGLVVQDNTSFTVGSSGTLATPLVTLVSTTIAALDAEFGTHVGSMGFLEIAGTLTLFVKQNNGNWGQVSFVFDAVNT